MDSETALEIVYGNSVGQSVEQGTGWQLPAKANTITTYVLEWNEVWQPGRVEVESAEQNVAIIDVLYRTSIKSEIVNEDVEFCDGSNESSSGSEAASQPTPIAAPTNTPVLPPTASFNCESLITSSRSLQLMDTGNRCWFKLSDGNSAELTFNQSAQITFAIGDGRGDRYFFIANPGDRLSDVYGATIRSIPFVNSQYGGIEQVREFETTYHNPGGGFPTCLRDWNNSNSPMISLCQ